VRSWNQQYTMTPDPHIAALVASTAGVGILMSLAGLQKSVLEWKRRRRICPSCGRELRGRVCGCS
jgi:NADH pyrophosphatase NudC (nudix superfamily)